MQFKPVFLGTADPNSGLAQLKRAADSQKVGARRALPFIMISPSIDVLHAPCQHTGVQLRHIPSDSDYRLLPITDAAAGRRPL